VSVMNRYSQYATEELLRTFEDAGAYLNATNGIFKAILAGSTDEGIIDQKRALLGTGLELFGEKNIIRILHLKDWFVMCDMPRLLKISNITKLGLPKHLFKKGAEKKVIDHLIKRAFIPSLQRFSETILERYKKDFREFTENKDRVEGREYILRNWKHPTFGKAYVQTLSDLGSEREVQDSLCFANYYLHQVWCTDDEELSQNTQEMFSETDWACYEILMFEALYFFLMAECKRRERDVDHQNQKLQGIIVESEIVASKQLDDVVEILSEKDKAIEDLQLLVGNLEQRVRQYEKMLSRTMSLPSERLENVRVLVVGHPVQKEMYEEEITVRGGIFEFVPSTTQEVSLTEIKSAVCRADLVLYLTTYTSHKVQESIKTCIQHNRLKYITCNGRTTFLRELERVMGESSPSIQQK
jgi:hypothetical protein